MSIHNRAGAQHIRTRWASEVSAEHPWPEHPRPQMARKDWLNLNGPWQFAVRPATEDRPFDFPEKILVPFPVESALSGIERAVSPKERLWYRRTVTLPSQWSHSRVLLHFGAVDWRAEVYINGRLAGIHEGGYEPFTIDVTRFLFDRDKEQEIVVAVWDPTNAGSQPFGKQTLTPQGIFYTAVSGIWQTVWMEPVPFTFIDKIRITPDLAACKVRVEVEAGGEHNYESFGARVYTDEGDIGKGFVAVGEPVDIEVPHPRLWTPETPFTYSLKISLIAHHSVDEVDSYFAMRSIEAKKAPDGFMRLHLNGKPLFMMGPLDQGWWPDGLYLAPTDEALRFDIDTMRAMGFNMVRKHVKVEPDRWYYWCDKLGLLVWQDMPSVYDGARLSIGPGAPNDAAFTATESAIFRRELRGMIDCLYNHPSIVAWVPFNEGWGQHNTNDILQWTKSYDPMRLVDGPSGWEDRGYGDMKDMHHYPEPDMFPAMDERVSVLGEYGGLGLPLEGHLWQTGKNWGYQTLDDANVVADRYAAFIDKLIELKKQGLAAAVYTQLTDVEGEVNGLLTYDRAVTKIPPGHLAALHEKLISDGDQGSGNGDQ